MVADEPVVPKSPMLKTMVSVMAVDSDVKIQQDEEPREPEIPPPKWIRNPAVQVCVIRWRSIIGDRRRSLIVVVVVYGCRIRILRGG